MTDNPSVEFVDLLTQHQSRLYRYIASLLGNSDAAWDVLQETNRVLLEKRDEFEMGTNFVNWALTVAQFQTMAWLRNQTRDRHLLTSELVEQMGEDARELETTHDERQKTLQGCLKNLSEENRELVHCRYTRSETLADLSGRTGRTVNALKQLFFRLRRTLADCVEQKLGPV